MLLFFLSLIETEEERNQFEKIFELYKDTMFYEALSILGKTDDAEDAVQQTFYKLALNTQWLKDTEDITSHKTRAYLVISVGNTAKTEYVRRKQRRAAAISIDEMDEEISDGGYGENEILKNVDLKELTGLIWKLPETDRHVLLLKYTHDRSDKEISLLLRINNAAVRKRLERARKKLEIMLRNRYEVSATV